MDKNSVNSEESFVKFVEEIYLQQKLKSFNDQENVFTNMGYFAVLNWEKKDEWPNKRNKHRCTESIPEDSGFVILKFDQFVYPTELRVFHDISQV